MPRRWLPDIWLGTHNATRERKTGSQEKGFCHNRDDGRLTPPVKHAATDPSRSHRFTVAWPFVADQSNAAGQRVLDPTIVKAAGLWCPPLRQNWNAIRLAGFEKAKLTSIGRGNDSATTHLPERADALVEAKAHQHILERPATRAVNRRPQGLLGQA